MTMSIWNNFIAIALVVSVVGLSAMDGGFNTAYWAISGIIAGYGSAIIQR